MVSTYSPNINLEEPARGDQVGTWDTPVNNNMNVIDLILGGQTTISLNNSPVVLAAAQFQCKSITFNSTLTGNVTITFPSTFIKTYEVYNLCTGTSAFTITLQTTLAGREVICAPPGEYVNVINNGADLKFVNLGRVGSYWDYAGSSVPSWVSGCTVPPYLNCDGTAFSSGLYPALANILGGTTLPDSKGRVRMAEDQSAGRVSSAVSGFAPNTVGAAGGGQSGTIASSHIPAHSHPVSDPGHTHNILNIGNPVAAAGGGINVQQFGNNQATQSAVTGLTVSNSTYANSGFPIMQPTYVGGLTLIRSA